MSKIKSIIAREIKDSRQNPTVEVELETEKGVFIASVASGASTGENEALELRDADGKGVSLAIKNINKIIAPKLKGKDVVNQQELDELMISLDGTENKSKLGANAILPVSMAICRAGAGSKKVSLYKYIAELSGKKVGAIPLPMFNVLEGGAHVHSEKHLDIQEFIIIPQNETFAENLVSCSKIFQKLEELCKKDFGLVEFGDEGGFALQISKTEQALYLLKNAIDGEKANIALDCAASQFYNTSAGSVGKYNIDGRELTKAELLEFYEELVKSFSIISIEDPFSEEDWQGFESIAKQLGKKITVVGDDLTTTNIERIKEAHIKSACNGVILKLNQIGTVSETIKASNLAKSFGWKTIVSHRSGETMDDFIADLSVGLGADYLKAGSPTKPERMVKYQRLLQIEEELKQSLAN
ncbi:MAG: phosphopyruvate hydratase [Candidatus Staskawiczbacteria bacterium]|nr:phosphopyruvate hydratase [Candidatus Staskawiczbacteria bacterium]